MALPDDEIHKRLSSSNLVNWELKDDKIVKNFQLPSFRYAINFVNKIADISESYDHHPTITIIWKTVRISLKSFDVNAITERDFKLAIAIENNYKFFV